MTGCHRILILGNTGSGKTWLANELARRLESPATELDALHWMPGGFNQKRPADAAAKAVRDAAAGDTWIIEGVFGWLAREALPRVVILVWLVIPEEECVENLKNRPVKSGEDEKSRAALLQWCLDYRTRTNANSYSAHLDIYENFEGAKHRLHSRDDIKDFLARFNSN